MDLVGFKRSSLKISVDPVLGVPIEILGGASLVGFRVVWGCSFIKSSTLQAARFSTYVGVSVGYLGAIARTSRGSSRTTFKKVLVRFKEVIRSFSKGSRRLVL